MAILKRELAAHCNTLFYNGKEGSGRSGLFGFMGMSIQNFSC